jgi:hypothetical protein
LILKGITLQLYLSKVYILSSTLKLAQATPNLVTRWIWKKERKEMQHTCTNYPTERW